MQNAVKMKTAATKIVSMSERLIVLVEKMDNDSVNMRRKAYKKSLEGDAELLERSKKLAAARALLIEADNKFTAALEILNRL